MRVLVAKQKYKVKIIRQFGPKVYEAKCQISFENYKNWHTSNFQAKSNKHVDKISCQ